MVMADETIIPEVGKRFLCRHPFNEQDRLFVLPSKVVNLNPVVYDGSKMPCVTTDLMEIRAHAKAQMGLFVAGDRCNDVLHLTTPKPFGVMVSDDLYKFLHRLWEDESIVREAR
uniref:nicotinate phosphoribosyltransferase n=2 Tax=Leptocylindrus danicus TaxID=163516 RepID=A0A7S2L555_9STRA|mmetsp:Transcript_31847/g.46313  ORF Transcript_31847/g.46313 Transcript_31847/m.46313 type:complete len:114 (+) Transcript_31847:123-464(+)